MPSKTPTTPRYQKLLDELVARIQSGRHPVGSLLPTEHQLCDEFQLSRFTIREALRRMAEMGMVERLSRQGTRVVSERPAAAYVQALDSIDEVMRHVRDTRLNVVAIDIIAADDALAQLIRCEPGQKWLHVCGSRETRDDQLPLSWTDIYVAERYSGIMGDISTSGQPLYELILRRYGVPITDIEQDIGATIVSPTMALALRVRPNSPALLVTRRAYNIKGEIIEVSVNTQPSARYTFSLHVRQNRTSLRQVVGEQNVA